MSDTPDNHASWRDLADELTPEQIAALEKCDDDDLFLMQMARMFVCQNLAVQLYRDDCGAPEEWRDTFTDVAAPPDATWVGAWTLRNGTRRLFRGTQRGGFGGAAEIWGAQDSDGSVIPRKISLIDEEGRGAFVDVADARQAAAQAFAMAVDLGDVIGTEIGDMVLAAANEIDELEGVDR
jgi:hypothetical protein